uniref:Uncharacterized protein n=1 Tax=Sinorhizobium meliloti (strain SM11) TaxID=707241 RepID=Q1WLH2_SINMM|nr:hypothetical protein [Sinorhizobium meliloti]
MPFNKAPLLQQLDEIHRDEASFAEKSIKCERDEHPTFPFVIEAAR